ncbi:MAG: crotonase/enoyl-CoA hydratase family protein [Oceanococcus sp.]
MSDRVTFQIEYGIADVRFNRADRHNALDAEQLKTLFDVGQVLSQRQDVRVIVLSALGHSFCSGLDFPSFQQPGQDLNIAFTVGEGSPANYAQRVATVWRNQPVPVIAAIHGVAFGGGFQLAMSADIRIAAPDSKFCIMEIDYGLIPDMAISQTLPPVVPYDRALELTLSGRKFSGEEAQALGIVTELADDPYVAAMAMAAQMAARSPDAVRGTKALYLQSWPQNTQLLLEEARLQQAIMAKPNFGKAVAAKLQKRAATFNDVAD